MTRQGRAWLTVRQWAKALAFLGACGLIAFWSGAGAKTIVDLQPFRMWQSRPIQSPAGRRGTVTLVNLNPAIGAWYVLTIAWNDAPERAYHLENPRPRNQVVALDPNYPSGLLIVEGAARYRCDLFDAASAQALEHDAAAGPIFEPLCESRLYVRNHASGRHTRLE